MKEKIYKQYAKAMAPVFAGSLGMAVYYFSDGLFIGNALGDDGMSAITISWTIVNLLTAVATGIGMGDRYDIPSHWRRERRIVRRHSCLQR